MWIDKKLSSLDEIEDPTNTSQESKRRGEKTKYMIIKLT